MARAIPVVPYHILIVDDSPEDRETYRRRIARGVEQDYLFTESDSGEEALERYRTELPDCVLLDYSLPDLNGLEFLARLRVEHGNEPLPVVMLTGQGNETVAVQALKMGAEDYLVKGRAGEGVKHAVHGVIEKFALRHQVEEQRRELERGVEALRESEKRLHDVNAQLRRRLDQLGALRRIDMAITSSLDERLTLETLLDQVVTQLKTDAASVLLLDADTATLNYATRRGFLGRRFKGAPIRLGEGLAGRAALERRMVVVRDLAAVEERFVGRRMLEAEGFVSYYAVPLLAKGQVKGILEVCHRAALFPDAEWLDFLQALAGQAAIAVDYTSLFKSLQGSNLELTQAYDATIEGWSRALDLRDKQTEGHTQRVTEMTLRVARAMDIDGPELVNMRRGALLHDIGKLGIPDSILLKPGPLTREERAIMQRHPTYAHEWLSPIPFLRPALDIPCSHHEKWDGTGYPHGLKGEQIPLAARIFAVVDVSDALRRTAPTARIGRKTRSTTISSLWPGRTLIPRPSRHSSEPPDSAWIRWRVLRAWSSADESRAAAPARVRCGLPAMAFVTAGSSSSRVRSPAPGRPPAAGIESTARRRRAIPQNRETPGRRRSA
jgi:response regulator RpfG family c-di-GMP phosphodiesterase